MNHSIQRLTTLLTIILISACSGVKVSTDYDSGADFSHLESFTWYSPSPTEVTRYSQSDIMDKRIRRNIASGLVNKGYRDKANGPPDFFVNYSVTTEDKINVDTYNTYAGYAPGWGWRGAGYGHRGMYYGMDMVNTEIDVDQYKEGTLILDIIEPDTGHLIWRGLASKRLPSSSNTERLNALVAEVVSELLKNFPPDTTQ